MVRHHPSLRGTAAAIAVIAVFVLLVASQQPAYTDDIDLLRFTTAKPYVFFIVDNSASMALDSTGKWVHANGDDPRSKLYQVKRVVYNVLKDVNDIQFGFASFNQDFARVTAKHWLYYYKTTNPSNALPNNWPINYPAADNDGPIDDDGVTVKSDIDGDLMTFGARINSTDILGTCPSPLPFGAVGADDREKINRFSKLGALGSTATQLWIKGGNGNKTYLLTVDRPSKKPDDITQNPALGQDDMDVRLILQEVKTNGCTGDQTADFQNTYTTRLTLTLFTDFLMNDEDNGRDVDDDSHNGGVDFLAGFWDAKDIQDAVTCGSGHPFSGKGWEGNYDGNYVGPPPSVPSGDDDKFCSAGPASCYRLKRPTVPDPDYGRPLDKGDMLPFDWRVEQKTEFLQRFAPTYPGAPDFRIASFFKDDVDPVTGVLPLNDETQIPLYASGPSPLSKAVIDFRCWYLGEGNKCNESAYNPGWEAIAASKDSEWGCRRPYLIVLSDGGDSCTGENPCADTANLNSKAGVKTWVVAYGAAANCTGVGNPLSCMAQNGKGELLCPQTATDLKTELERILGLIRQEARSFASAAVPSVQALVDDKIFLTNFTPLNGESTWDGHVHAFFKPIPRTNDGRPDTSAAAACPRTPPSCPSCTPQYSDCHAWDAGKVMTTTQVNAADPTGEQANQRRVYYGQENNSTVVPSGSRLFEKTDTPTGTATEIAQQNAIRYDLWRGLGIPFTEGDTTSEATAQTAANTIIANTFAIKTATVDVKNPDGTTTPVTIQYVLGDIFHSNPLVVGSPPNVQYFSLDLNGYRAFADKHELRRKMLLVGANDGMLHGFDAGIYNRDSTNFRNKFDKGTGKEVFAYMPRGVLPAVKSINSPGATNHQWSVDGTVTVADTFIDPKNGGSFGAPKADQREWRTVAVGGLREGGTTYYALDITQPDTIGGDGEPDWINGYVPSCHSTPSTITDGDNSGPCGPLPFPSLLWEFDDSVVESGNRVQLDEEDTGFPSGDGDPDGNLKPDVGETWSIPNVGRIRIAVTPGSDETRDVYVAVFGGGLDPNNPTSPQMGTWLYMVDIETGQPIYKRQLKGAVPSEPAAVDTNGDGYLDRIYIGTMAGLLYRVDLTADILNDLTDPEDDQFPALEAELVTDVNGGLHTVERIPKTSWVARAIFNASFDALTGLPTPIDRPIFFRPSVVYDAKLGVYLIAVGTGYRDDLWNNDGQSGRFYVFLDDTDKISPASLPLKENAFRRILVPDLALGGNLETLPLGQRGWYLVLDVNERVINDPFALSGVTFFSTYKPRVDVTSTKEGPQCSKTGFSRIFIVNTLNADPFVQPPTGVSEPPTRAFEVANFVTNPFTEQRQTKNKTAGDDAEICDDPTKMAIMESLKTLFPPTCKFGNSMVDIKTIAADTTLVCIAPVPVCLIQKNWKEF